MRNDVTSLPHLRALCCDCRYIMSISIDKPGVPSSSAALSAFSDSVIVVDGAANLAASLPNVETVLAQVA